MSLHRWVRVAAGYGIALVWLAGCSDQAPDRATPPTATTAPAPAPTWSSDDLVARLRTPTALPAGWKSTAQQPSNDVNLCATTTIRATPSPFPAAGQVTTRGMSRQLDPMNVDTFLQYVVVYPDAATADMAMRSLVSQAEACPPSRDQPRQKAPGGGTAVAYHQDTSYTSTAIGAWRGFTMVHARTDEQGRRSEIREILLQDRNALLAFHLGRYSDREDTTWGDQWRALVEPVLR